MNTPETSAGALLPRTPCSASLTPGPWRYQKETTHTVLGPKAPPRVRYQIYKDGGIYGHPATCDREADARAIAMLPEIVEALRPFAHYACNPEEGPCHCHNCRARFVLAEALGPDWQNDPAQARRPADGKQTDG